MSDFKQALEIILAHEGGYVNDPDDPGGETYRGIARKMNSKWPGWVTVDLLKLDKKAFPKNLDQDDVLQAAIRAFYEANYWDRIRGDDFSNQDAACAVFDFAVNAGVVASSKVAQVAARVAVDGVIGSVTVAKINAMDPRVFLSLFALGRIARYAAICEKRPESRKFFYGWVKRTLEAV